MKVIKVLNNNAVIAVDENGVESVVFGKGLAYKAKQNAQISHDLVDKVFVLKNENEVMRYVRLFEEIPKRIFNLTDKYITLAKKKFNIKLQNFLYISLADHLNSMIERGKINAYIQNKMLWDVRRMYKHEFLISSELVDEFNEIYNTSYNDHEIATIALHFVNASIESNLETTVKITKFISEILDIVKYHFMIDYNEESYSYHRFVVHLRFFAERIMSENSIYDDENDLLGEYITDKYKQAFDCAEKIKRFIKTNYGFLLKQQECLFLTVHIVKVVDDSMASNKLKGG